MSSSPNRKKKRATATVVNHAVKKANGGLGNLAKADEVNKAFQQLSQNQEKLAQLVNQNFGAVHGAFDLVDGHQHVTRRIINDIVKGDVRVCEDPSEGVDYQWYFMQYNACRAVLTFLTHLAKLLQKEEAEEQKDEEKLGESSAGKDLVFGGDYAHQDSQAG